MKIYYNDIYEKILRKEYFSDNKIIELILRDCYHCKFIKSSRFFYEKSNLRFELYNKKYSSDELIDIINYKNSTNCFRNINRSNKKAIIDKYKANTCSKPGILLDVTIE